MNPVTIEHATVGVEDIDAAVEFYTQVMGLGELTREDGVAYLACGRDSNFDVAVAEGDTGLEHVAFRVDGSDTIEEYATHFDTVGIEFERRDGTEPGQTAGLRFRLPSNIAVELVVVDDAGYPHSDESSHPDRPDVAPLDFDHVNVRTPSLEADVRCLVDAGFAISEIIGTTDDWTQVFVRGSHEHHDIALGPLGSDSDRSSGSLHHIALQYSGIDHMKRGIDALAHADIPLERGLGRHYAGDNLFAYFWAPGGTRVEFVAEMANVYTDEVEYLSPDMDYSTAWGAERPDGWDELCGLVGYND